MISQGHLFKSVVQAKQKTEKNKAKKKVARVNSIKVAKSGFFYFFKFFFNCCYMSPTYSLIENVKFQMVQVVICNCSTLWSYIRNICWKSWLTGRGQLWFSSCVIRTIDWSCSIVEWKVYMIAWGANLKYSWLDFAVVPFTFADIWWPDVWIGPCFIELS